MSDLREKLKESGCSDEFIEDAMRYERLYEGDVEDFIEVVEDILMNDEEYDEDFDEDDEEDDPISRSEFDYEGNEVNIFFEDEDGEEPFEDDDEEN